MIGFTLSQKEGAATWEDLYVKEIARVIDVSEADSEIEIDVTKAVEVANKRGQSLSKVFNFDNVNKEVIVSLRQGNGKAYAFFNDVAIADWKLESDGVSGTKLSFKTIEELESDEVAA